MPSDPMSKLEFLTHVRNGVIIGFCVVVLACAIIALFEWVH